MGARARSKTIGPFGDQIDRVAVLDERLAIATTSEELSELAGEYHSVSFTLAEEVSALALEGGAGDATLVAGGTLLDRASAGKRAAAERAATVFAAAGELKHAVHHLFEALSADPDDVARAELVERIVVLLQDRQPAAAQTVRKSGDNVEQAKSAIDWTAL